MDKLQLWDQLIEHTEQELAQVERAARDAAEYATDDEAKAESKWDTQGLEASYLAAGQAKKVGEFREALSKLQAMRTQINQHFNTVREGSLVTLNWADETNFYLIVPAAGGAELKQDDGTEVWTLTPPTPLGQRLIGKSASSSIRMPNGTNAEIISIQ
ncbi:MAG: transcription elongation factor GreAB [Opitutales bacterium]